MRSILTILFSTICLIFIGCALYILEIPPFNPGGPFIKGATGSQQLADIENINTKTIDKLKVERSKTYKDHINKGLNLENAGQHALAITEFQAAINLEPEQIQPYLEIGRIHLRNKIYIKAKEAFEKAVQIDPKNLEAQIYLIRTLLADRQIADAQKIADQITEASQSVKYYKGIIAAYKGEYERSRQLLQEAAADGTSAIIATQAKNYLAAYSEFEINKEGANLHLQTLLSRSFVQTGEYQMAIPLLYEVIKGKKDYRDAWILLGYAYLQIQQYREAIDALEEARKLDTQKSETLFYLGLAYYGNNNLELAVENLELAKRNGYQPVIQINQKLAEIYLLQKDYDKSAQAYEHVLTLNNSDINVYIRPVWIYLEKLHAPQKALALAKKAEIAHPDNAMSYNLLGWASIASGKLTDAEIYLKKAATLDPKLDAVWLNYGILYETRNDYPKAVSSYQKAFTIGQGNSISIAANARYKALLAKTETGMLKANTLVTSNP